MSLQEKGVQVQDSTAQPNLTSYCKARVLHMRHTTSQQSMGIPAKYTFLAFIEKGTQIKESAGKGLEGTT